MCALCEDSHIRGTWDENEKVLGSITLHQANNMFPKRCHRTICFRTPFFPLLMITGRPVAKYSSSSPCVGPMTGMRRCIGKFAMLCRIGGSASVTSVPVLILRCFCGCTVSAGFSPEADKATASSFAFRFFSSFAAFSAFCLSS